MPCFLSPRRTAKSRIGDERARPRLSCGYADGHVCRLASTLPSIKRDFRPSFARVGVEDAVRDSPVEKRTEVMMSPPSSSTVRLSVVVSWTGSRSPRSPPVFPANGSHRISRIRFFTREFRNSSVPVDTISRRRRGRHWQGDKLTWRSKRREARHLRPERNSVMGAPGGHDRQLDRLRRQTSSAAGPRPAKNHPRRRGPPPHWRGGGKFDPPSPGLAVSQLRHGALPWRNGARTRRHTIGLIPVSQNLTWRIASASATRFSVGTRGFGRRFMLPDYCLSASPSPDTPEILMLSRLGKRGG